jgi:hypothetical protein
MEYYTRIAVIGAGGPGLNHDKTWVPHLRDSLIVAKVGMQAPAEHYCLD